MKRDASRGPGKFFLDTNAIIAYLAGDERAAAWIESADELWMSVICRGELLYGALRSKHAEKNLRQLDLFQSQCAIFDCSLNTAWWYGNIRADLAQRGKPIPEADVWIAAICLQHQSPLLTADDHFDQVSKLHRLDWRKPLSTRPRRKRR